MTARARLLAGGGVLVAVVLAFAVCGLQVDRYEVAYPDVFQARAEEATERDWIPDWIPEEASGLRAVRDTNGTAALFRADLPAAAPSPTTCRAAGSIAEPTLTADWFPADAMSLGDPLQCEDWVGVRGDGALLLWRP